MSKISLIMSLNNPDAYYLTRHNVGLWWLRYFCFLNEICLFKDDRFLAKFAAVKYMSNTLFLLESFNYINCSGDVLLKFLSFYNINVKSILIVHDDLDLSVGDIRLKFSGNNSSHNGLSSVSSKLNSSDFYRLRIGIGSTTANYRKDYVLNEPNYNDRFKILNAIRCSFFLIDDILNLSFANFKTKFSKLLNSVERSNG